MERNTNMIIAVDFDGTCVTHDFPRIGKDIGAIPILKRLVKRGHKLILFTMRSDIENPISNDYGTIPQGGMYLTDAVNWFKENGIELFGINENPEQKSWTNSPKPYAHLYIDDAALGCPLMVDGRISERPFVNWDDILYALKSLDLI